MRKIVLASTFENIEFICGPQHEIDQPQCASVGDAIETLKDLIKVQCSEGNWNYDAYMHGLANGLIVALSCLDGKSPKFMSAPKEWLADRHSDSDTTAIASSKINIRASAINALARVRKVLATDETALVKAYQVVCKAMQNDPEYAWSWHCNVAMTCQDAGAPYKEANDWTATFMKNAFGVDTIALVKERCQAVASDSGVDTFGKAYAVFKRFGITGFKSPKMEGGKGKQTVKATTVSIKNKKSVKYFHIWLRSKGNDIEYQLTTPGSENYSSDTVIRKTTNIIKFVENLCKVSQFKEYRQKMGEWLDEKNNSSLKLESQSKDNVR